MRTSDKPPLAKPSLKERAIASIKEGIHLDKHGLRDALLLKRLFINRDRSLIIAKAKQPAAEGWREKMADVPLGPDCPVSHAEIRSKYDASWDPAVVDKVILSISLFVTLSANGLNNGRNEEVTMAAAKAIGVPDGSHLSVQDDAFVFVVDGGPAHHVPVLQRKIYATLCDVYALAEGVTCGDVQDVGRCLEMLDELRTRPMPWGWIWCQLSDLLFPPFCTWAYFNGSWESFCTCLWINAMVMALCALFRRVPPLANLLPVLQPLLVGLFVPMLNTLHFQNVWLESCQQTAVTLGLVINLLPGTDLIRGAFSAFKGQAVDGTSRLMTAYIQIIWLGLSIQLGWQFFGGFIFNEDGTRTTQPTFFVPACLPDGKDAEWWMRLGVVNIPTILILFPGLHIRAADAMAVVACAVGAMCVQHELNATWPGLVGYTVNVFTLTAMCMAANVYRLLTGTLEVVCISPLIVCMAPGAGALMRCFKATAILEGDAFVQAGVSVLFELLSTGSSLAMGMYLAEEFFKPIHQYRLSKRGQQNLQSMTMIISSAIATGPAAAERRA